jgi:hypothetical protein
LSKFIGKERLDFLFPEAEMEGFNDESLHGGTDLGAARVDPEAGRLVGDIGADAAFGFDEVVPFEELINFCDGERVDVELGGKVADGGKLGSVGELSRENALLELVLQLHIKGDAAVGVEEEHGVIV